MDARISAQEDDGTRHQAAAQHPVELLEPGWITQPRAQCGAVTAAIDHLANADGEAAEVVSLLYRIEPAIIGIPADLPRAQRIDNAMRRNVELAVRRLSRVPDLSSGLNTGSIKIVGAVYDMHSGKVEVLG